MGTGEDRISPAAADGTIREASTTLLVLVALKSCHPRPMSTYELGLAITDDKHPPRPLSVLIKTLKKDKYIERASLAGKRAGYWRITERGLDSLRRRPASAAEAAAWLVEHPNYTIPEQAVLRSLRTLGPQPASRLAASCGMLHSPIRTALKRLNLRRMVNAPRAPATEYALTSSGLKEAERLSD
jgi:DNA-binding PadR family transcriptional regulator